MQDQWITYEQPLNESIRMVLKLADLFSDLRAAEALGYPHYAQPALGCLIGLLELLHRPDLKSKITQSLTQHATSLAQLEQFQQVDAGRLSDLLAQLDRLIAYFHRQPRQVCPDFRQDLLLNELRLKRSVPGGIAMTASPAYQLWLRQSEEAMRDCFAHYHSALAVLEEAVTLILFLTRQNVLVTDVRAKQGFYQQALDANLPSALVSVRVPAALFVFPEFSLGRHRISLRFISPVFPGIEKPKQLQSDFDFQLRLYRE